MYTKKLTKVGALLGTTALLLGSFALIPQQQVQAAGVPLTVTPSTRAVSTTGTITLGYTSTAVVPTSGNIRVAISSSYTGTATFTINAAAATFTSATSGGFTTYTLTPSVSVPVGATTIVVSGLTSPATQGNYPASIFTSTGDYSANFQYVGQANVVNVRAIVPVSLSFAIRNSADTADTNTCDMGILSTSTLGNCNYRLKIGGNPVNGFTVSVQTSGNFTNGTSSFANAAVGTAGTGGTNIVAGTERYGVVVTPGSITNGTTSLAAAYNAGATNSVSFVDPTVQTLATYSGPNNPGVSGDTTNTILVNHNAGISSNTPAGVYTQTVTYTVTPSF